MRRLPGFSLIELLVVVSIIALLVGIMVPVLGSAMQASRATACMSNLHQQGVAWETAMADHGGQIPRTAGLDGWDHSRDRWWHHLLSEYMTPGKIQSAEGDPLAGNSKAEEDQIICPQIQKDSMSSTMWVGRIWNAYAVNVRWEPGSKAGANELQSWYKVRTPSIYPWIGDPVYQQHHSGTWQVRHRIGYVKVWENFSRPDLDMPAWGLGFNHNGVGYAVFADAHVGQVDELDFEAVNDEDVPEWFFNR